MADTEDLEQKDLEISTTLVPAPLQGIGSDGKVQQKDKGSNLELLKSKFLNLSQHALDVSSFIEEQIDSQKSKSLADQQTYGLHNTDGVQFLVWPKFGIEQKDLLTRCVVLLCSKLGINILPKEGDQFQIKDSATDKNVLNKVWLGILFELSDNSNVGLMKKITNSQKCGRLYVSTCRALTWARVNRFEQFLKTNFVYFGHRSEKQKDDITMNDYLLGTIDTQVKGLDTKLMGILKSLIKDPSLITASEIQFWKKNYFMSPQQLIYKLCIVKETINVSKKKNKPKLIDNFEYKAVKKPTKPLLVTDKEWKLLNSFITEFWSRTTLTDKTVKSLCHNLSTAPKAITILKSRIHRRRRLKQRLSAMTTDRLKGIREMLGARPTELKITKKDVTASQLVKFLESRSKDYCGIFSNEIKGIFEERVYNSIFKSLESKFSEGFVLRSILLAAETVKAKNDMFKVEEQKLEDEKEVAKVTDEFEALCHDITKINCFTKSMLNICAKLRITTTDGRWHGIYTCVNSLATEETYTDQELHALLSKKASYKSVQDRLRYLIKHPAILSRMESKPFKDSKDAKAKLGALSNNMEDARAHISSMNSAKDKLASLNKLKKSTNDFYNTVFGGHLQPTLWWQKDYLFFSYN